MNPKIKNPNTGEKEAVNAATPLITHDATQPTDSAKAASRRPKVAIQPPSGTANHARHHAGRHTQS